MKNLLLLALLLTSNVVLAQQYLPFMDNNGKWGYRDFSNNVVIQPQYDKGFSFVDGFACVAINSSAGMQYGVINRSGKVVIPLVYPSYITTKGGFCSVSNILNKYAIFDSTGKAITPFKYDALYTFVEGIARVNIGWRIEPGSYNNGNGKWGFVDQTGKEIVPIQYSYVDDFRNGMAAVAMGGNPSSDELLLLNAKWGFINKEGKEVVPLQYEQVSYFREGLASVVDKGKYGFVDLSGRVVVPLQYGWAESFNQGIALVNMGCQINNDGQPIGGKYGLIDRSGKALTPIKYDFMHVFREGLAVVRIGKKFGVINMAGEEVVKPTYEAVSQFRNGMACFNVGGIWESGGEIVGGKWGFFDKTGKVALPAIYEWVGSDFIDGLALVKIEGKYQVIDLTGNIVRPMIVPDGYVLHGFGFESRGKVEKKDGSDVYYIDLKGNKTNKQGQPIQ